MAAKPPNFDDLTAFPIMVSDGYTATLGAPAAPPSVPPGDVGATASSAIKNALGWSWKPGSDPKALIGALNQSFKAVPRQGRIDYAYQQRSYSVAVQADLGAITGAQKSIYTRARAMLDQMLLLLAGLKPLLPDPDLSEIEAVRSLVRNELSQIVEQLGVEGGPNVQLVDEWFSFLGGEYWGVDDPDPVKGTPLNFQDVGGHLGELRRTFGLSSRWVTTIDEEQDLTDLVVLVDYISTMYISWVANRKYFTGMAAQPFMGTALVLVSRALAVVAESVDELCYVCGTVFIGPAERQTLKLTYRDGPPIFFADLLDWVRRFASEEGPQTINESGKDGIVTFTRTAQRLKKLVDGAAIKTEGGQQAVKDVPAGYKTKRVQDQIKNLSGELADAIGQADKIKRYPAPSIRYWDIDADSTGGVRVTVGGTEFRPGAEIRLGFSSKAKADAAEIDPKAKPAKFTHVTDSRTALGRFDNLAGLDRDLARAGGNVHLLVKNDDGQIAIASFASVTVVSAGVIP